jgi:SAM-dependent methyltransferase
MSEREHFERLFRQKGYTWWGRETPAGRRRDEKKVELFRRLAHPRPGDRLLEVGCGSGEFTVRFQGLGLEVWAFDLTPPCVAHAAQVLDAEKEFQFIAADITRIPFPTSSFDIVFGVSILHHVPLEAAFAEIIRVIRPGGRFFFSEPNMLNPQIFLQKSVPWLKRRLGDSPGETAFVRRRLRRFLNSLPGVKAEVRNIDFLHPLVPAALVSAGEKISDFLEKVPLIREISGSLAVSGAIAK